MNEQTYIAARTAVRLVLRARPGTAAAEVANLKERTAVTEAAVSGAAAAQGAARAALQARASASGAVLEDLAFGLAVEVLEELRRMGVGAAA